MCRLIKKMILPIILVILLLAFIILSFQFSDFLNQNNGVFTLIFTGVVALATVVYAILTWMLVSETKEMREAQTEPRVSVVFQPREEWINFIDLIVKNIGLGPAYDIKFNIKPDFEYRSGHFLSQMNFIKNGVKYLNPNQKIQFFLTSMVENFDNKIKIPLTIEVTYKNKFGKRYSENFVIDFSELVGLGQLGEPPLHKIAKNIEDIRKDIGHLSTGFHRIKTIVYTKKDIDNENKQILKRIKKQKKTNAPSP